MILQEKSWWDESNIWVEMAVSMTIQAEQVEECLDGSSIVEGRVAWAMVQAYRVREVV